MKLTDETIGTLLEAGVSYEHTIKRTRLFHFPFQVGIAFTLPLFGKRAIIFAKRYMRDDQWVHEF